MGRRGRPYSKDKRNKQCMIRINEAEDELLAETCKMTGMGQADVFRTALERMYWEEKYKDIFPLSPLLDKRMNKED